MNKQINFDWKELVVSISLKFSFEINLKPLNLILKKTNSSKNKYMLRYLFFMKQSNTKHKEKDKCLITNYKKRRIMKKKIKK